MQEFEAGEGDGNLSPVERLEEHFDLAGEGHDRTVEYRVIRQHWMGVQADRAFPYDGFRVH